MNRNRLRLTRAVLLLVPAYDRTIDPTTGPTRTFPPLPHSVRSLSRPSEIPMLFPLFRPDPVREIHPKSMESGYVTRVLYVPVVLY